MNRWLTMRCSVAFALVCALACVPSLTAAPTHADPAAPVRILLVGDSTAQGSAGDWTWRYRVWRALTDAGVDFDFVGPRDDLYDNVTDQFGSQAYADPAFDRDHAARWGMALAFPDDDMADLVADYQPDIVVETRGINDLTWLQGTPDKLRTALADEIAEARGVDPGVDFVVGELPQLWLDGLTASHYVTAYDDELPAFAEAQSTAESRVVPALTGGGFVEFVDTWDPAHFAASGELKFAAGIVDALADLGVGVDYPRPLPEVVNGHWGGATVTAVSGDGTADLSWIRPPGGRAEFVWQRDVTAGEPWRRLPASVEGTTWSAAGLVNGHRYAFRLQAMKGESISVSYSNEVQVVPNPPAPGAPSGVAATPGPHRLAVAWEAAPGATSYVVSWKGAVTGDRGSRTVTSRAIVLRDLLAGERYDVTVTPLNDTVPGPVGRASARPTGPVPAAPRGLRATRPAPHRANLQWRPAAHATSYAVWQRTGASWRLVRTTTSTTMTVRGVPKGVVAFKVRSWHQLLTGGWSPPVRVR